MTSQFPATIVANADQQIQAIAIPLDPHTPGFSLVDEGEHGVADDGSGLVRDLSWERPPGSGRLDELHVQITVPHERAKIAAQTGERADDRFEQRAALLIGRHPQTDHGGRGDVRRCLAGGTVVEPPGAERRENRLEGERMPVGLLGHRARVLDEELPRNR